MRLWTLHPKYLDSVGLVSLWRKALLAREVLRGRTKGYRNHPQLERFRSHASPLSAINAYLHSVYGEAAVRGYAFDKRKLGAVRDETPIRVTDGQLSFEKRHLRRKLVRRRARGERIPAKPEAHPLFRIVPGPVEDWERRGHARRSSSQSSATR